MSLFRFKQFTVKNERSAMKVNTDGVLLGALMSVREGDVAALDVGTGTGTVALMAAQRMAAVGGAGLGGGRVVLGIEIDGPSAGEAAENFRESPWGDWVFARKISLQEFAKEWSKGRFDHIFSNPPYFDETLKAPDPRRRAARHSDSLSWRDIIDFSVEALSEEGLLSLILPASTETEVCRYARMCGLFPSQIIRIRTTERKPASRIILEFSRHRQLVEERVFTIHSGAHYSDEYIAATAPFYLNLQ